jgi:Skp family chaperone for outer membrane proteins
MSMKKVGLVGLLLGALMLAGCDELTGRTGHIAIIDLDAVARALGRDEVIAQQVNQANQQLTSQLQEIAQSLQAEIDQEREALQVVSDEQEAELARKAQEANQRLAQTRQLAQQRAQEFRQAVINNFRNEVQPYAEEVATKRGAKAILTVAAPMIWYDNKVDITGDVIAKMREAGLANGQTTTPPPAAPEGGNDS